MVSELKKSIDANKTFFGIRECTKNVKKLDKVIVSADARTSTIEELKKHGAVVEITDFNKVELADKLEIDFLCEVFGVRK
jgi:ribosomal protein L7Ae-like RNA K-turn-binding protein